MGFELAEVVAELGRSVLIGGELEGGEDGLMDLPRAPSCELGTAVEENFHQTEHAGVVDLDAGDFAVACGDGASQALEQWEIDMDIESLGFEGGESIGNGSECLPHGFQVV